MIRNRSTAALDLIHLRVRGRVRGRGRVRVRVRVINPPLLLISFTFSV
jgi:hypothetical protein